MGKKIQSLSDFQRNNNYQFEIKFSEIEFGISDGELESHEDNFEDFFYKPKFLTELESNKNIFFAIGKKGAGKTYLGKYLEKSQPQKYFYFNDLEKQVRVLSEDYESKDLSLILELIFLKSLLKLIESTLISINHLELLKELKKTKDRIEESFSKNKLALKFLSGVSSVMKSLSFGMTDFAVDFDSPTALFLEQLKVTPKGEKSALLDSLKNHVFSFLKKYCEVFDDAALLIDGIDQFTEHFHQDINVKNNHNHYLTTLLDTIYNLNTDFLREKVSVRFVLLMRTDIFYSIKNANFTKYKDNSTLSFKWIDNGGCDFDNKLEVLETDLFKMLQHRLLISSKLKLGGELHSSNSLVDLFPNEFLSLETKEKKPIGHILDYTHKNPRELLKIFNLIQRFYPSSSLPLDSHVFSREVFAEYAKFFEGEIKDELGLYKENPELNQVFRLLKRMARYKGPKGKFSYELGVRKIKDICDEEGLENYADLLEDMFNSGLIGLKSKDNLFESNSFTYNYFGEYCFNAFDLDELTFVVHPTMRVLYRGVNNN